jgi:hypothetical protein
MDMQRNEIIELARKNGATIEAGKQPGTIIYEGTGGITFEVLELTVKDAITAERKACAKVCGDRAKAASIACDAGAYYEAEECEDAILKRSNVKVIGESDSTVGLGVLLPCPFCGSGAFTIHSGSHGGVTRCENGKCGARTCSDYSKKDSQIAWNLREQPVIYSVVDGNGVRHFIYGDAFCLMALKDMIGRLVELEIQLEQKQ